MKGWGSGIQIHAFADELKQYCKEHHDELVPRWQLANQTKQYPVHKDDPIYGCTPILQWYGTNVARKQNPNVWVEALQAHLSKEVPEIAIITDVRFPNEADYIKQNAGFMVEVRRYKDGVQFLATDRDPNHPSEIALDKYEEWDFTIDHQDGDLATLRKKSIGVFNAIHLFENKFATYDEYVDVCYSNDILESINGYAGGFQS